MINLSVQSSLPLSSTSAPPQDDAEFQFLCAIVGVHSDAAQIELIANSNLSALDWSELLRLGEHHGVLPLASHNLIAHARGLTPEIERSLRLAYEANMRRGLWFTAELARIMLQFERTRVRAVPYKGPLLAQSAYHDVALRSFSDLDFLISAAEFTSAKQALAELGYRPSTEFAPGIERFWLREGNEREFDSAAGKNIVELQWAVVPRFNAIDLRVEDLIGRAGRTVVGECEMPCLSPEDSLLTLCVHAAKHLWTRLIWLADVAETLRTANIDYVVAFARARQVGIARILAVNFWLVKNVLGRSLPRPVEEMVASDGRASALGREFADRLARGATYNFETTEYFRLSLKLRERRWDRWRCIWRLLWTPGAGDIASVRLPDALFPFYRIVRIRRLIRRLSG